MSSGVSIALAAECPSEGEWSRLLTGVVPEHRFLTRQWYRAWGAAFLPMDRWKGPLRWLVARYAERGLAGVIPLASQRIGPVSTLSLAGYYWPFRALPLDAGLIDEIAPAIANWAIRNARWTPWRLGPIPRDDPAVQCLIREFSRLGWNVMERRVGETFAVKFDGPFSAYEDSLSALVKKAIYYERRMGRSGELRICTTVVGDAAFLSDSLIDLEIVERGSWVSKNDQGVPKFLGERNRAFWSHLAGSGVVLESLRPMLLYVGGRPVSYSFNIDAGNTRYIVANGYDEEFANHSPGLVLAHHVLRDAAASGRSVVEWGQGDSGYKSRWHAEQNLRLVDVLILPRAPLTGAAIGLLERVGSYERIR